MLSEEMRQVLEYYNAGLALYRKRQFQEAKAQFEKALKIRPEDGPSKEYVRRCEHYIKNPPPDDWDGVFVMTTK
ncbi:MAG: tetratricopeptide repeat protein [Leptospiraceae bacterium]|nr:tetratricopeptide repeat protein [Leptospiraceae bacterium]MDW8307296.1 tetratricopeptide repeat protein [Leptospiraceae bacterium]